VIISHDRRFLSTLSRSTVWLDRGCTRRLERGFAHFEEWRDTALAEEEREQHKLDRKIVAEEHWLRYGVTGRRKRNVRRFGQLQALREQRRTFQGSTGNAVITAGSAAPSGALVIDAKGIGKSYDGRAIVKDFSIRILRGDRIGIAGPNGSGKTTLIGLLTGVLARTRARWCWFEPRRRHAQSASRQSRSEYQRHRGANRWCRPQRDGQRKSQACRQLHEGFSVHQRTGAHAARQALGRRTWPPHAGAGARQAVEPAGA
jgi:ATPase subunit of ABC transporter with duplicated ATPase domains